ncbi:MAG: cbb3-type cytochrome oxidase assembly protein [Anaerolineales bacterium]
MISGEWGLLMVYPGTWLVVATLAIILLLFMLGAYWAYRQGQFDDVEAAKYAMLENDRKHDDREL